MDPGPPGADQAVPQELPPTEMHVIPKFIGTHGSILFPKKNCAQIPQCHAPRTRRRPSRPVGPYGMPCHSKILRNLTPSRRKLCAQIPHGPRTGPRRIIGTGPVRYGKIHRKLATLLELPLDFSEQTFPNFRSPIEPEEQHAGTEFLFRRKQDTLPGIVN